MSEYNIKLTGWKAIAVLIVLLGVVGFRLMTFNDKKNDKALMRQIELQLTTEFLPNDVERLKAAFETGDEDQMQSVAESITSAKLHIGSVQASYPLFDFSTSKDVVVKVSYSLYDASGIRKTGTKYYLLKHGSIGNTWQYKYDTTVVSYYLNFF